MEKDRLKSRSGAKAGDALFACGLFGRDGLGLQMLVPLGKERTVLCSEIAAAVEKLQPPEPVFRLQHIIVVRQQIAEELAVHIVVLHDKDRAFTPQDSVHHSHHLFRISPWFPPFLT